jgi:hypothetical protein
VWNDLVKFQRLKNSKCLLCWTPSSGRLRKISFSFLTKQWWQNKSRKRRTFDVSFFAWRFEHCTNEILMLFQGTSLLEEEWLRYKIKNSNVKLKILRIKRKLRGRYTFIKYFFLKSLSYPLYLLCFLIMLNYKSFYWCKILNNQEIKLIQENHNLNRNCILPTKLVDWFI